MAIFNRFRNQMQRPGGFGGGFGGRFSPQQLPQQSRFGGGLGGLFGGMGGYNPYQQQMPRRGGMMGRRFNPMMGGGFNPMMGRGFNPMMGGGFNPMMGGGFNPMMGGGFQGYDFNSPIGEAPPGVEPTPPPSISDLFSGLDDDQRNSFLQQFGLAPTPTPRPDVDERDMFDSGSVPGEPGFSIERQGPGRGEEGFIGTMGGPVYDDAGNLIGNLGSAGPTFPPGVLGPIVGGEGGFGGGPAPMPEGFSYSAPPGRGYAAVMPSRGKRFAYGPQGERIEVDVNTIGLGGQGGQPALPPPPPQTGGGFEIPGIDLEKIRESLAKIEPIIPGISLPEPQPVPVKGPVRPTPTFVPEINPFDNPLFSDPGLGGEGMGGIRPMPMPMPQPMPIKGPRQPIKVSPPKIMPQPIPVKGPRQTIKTSPPKIMPMPQPMPMPAPMPKIRPMPAPLPRVISDPVRPKPAPITRGIGGVRRMPAGRRR